ncbi:MAG TPA: DUF3987 domain-containing protein [Prolixibacteraceae bacterium]|nr:DUF3987 domain-containing protein [Prolixibacteraceae bacterium]
MDTNITAKGIISEALNYTDQSIGAEFPVHVFPEKVREIISATGECLNFPTDYIASSLCFALSVGIGNTHVAKVKEGWTERAILYLALIGRPGTNKSHPLSFALQPLFEHDAEESVKFKMKYKEYEELLSRSKKELESQGILNFPEEPVLKKFVVSDVTPESLAFIHENNKRGICLYSDELASWFKNFNRYTKGSEEQFWLSLYNGKPIILDRRGAKNSVSVKRSFIGVIGTIQHGVLKELAKGERNQNGFLDRILFVLPKSTEKQYWNHRQLPLNIFPLWHKLMKELINLDYQVDENGDPVSLELPFENTAKEQLYAWQRKNTDLYNSESNEDMLGVYSKLEIYAVRFCLILQMVRWLCREAEKECIDSVSVQGAIELVEYFRKTAHRVQSFIGYTTRLEKLPTDKVKLYHALPCNFSTSEGIKIASDFSISEDGFKRFLSDAKENLLDNYKHGHYRKLI